MKTIVLSWDLLTGRYSIFLPLDVDTALNTFYDAMHQTMINFVPKYTFRKSTYPISALVYSKESIQILVLKNRLTLNIN